MAPFAKLKLHRSLIARSGTDRLAKNFVTVAREDKLSAIHAMGPERQLDRTIGRHGDSGGRTIAGPAPGPVTVILEIVPAVENDDLGFDERRDDIPRLVKSRVGQIERPGFGRRVQQENFYVGHFRLLEFFETEGFEVVDLPRAILRQ